MSRLKETRKDRVTVVMNGSLKDQLEVQAEDADRSLSDFIRIVLTEYIEALRGGSQIDLEEA